MFVNIFIMEIKCALFFIDVIPGIINFFHICSSEVKKIRVMNQLLSL